MPIEKMRKVDSLDVKAGDWSGKIDQLYIEQSSHGYCLRFLYQGTIHERLKYDLWPVKHSNGSDFSRNIVFSIDEFFLKEDVKALFVLRQWMSGHFVDESFETNATILDEFVLEHAVATEW